MDQPTPGATSGELKGMVNGSGVRQSPPPVTNERRIPNGAILSPPVSPPESNSSSDDDEVPDARGRQIENLRALQVAISQIPQHRESSPNKADAGDLLVLPSQASALAEGMHQSFSTGSLDELASGARRFSHTRSATEPNLTLSKSTGNSLTGSEEDSEEDLQRKPQMVRKKSGELVRPALRPPSRRRPSSMPGTPTFSKAVHFDSHLEHVRHFLQVDRPLAVSAGSSPVDNYESDCEYPFPGDEQSGPRSLPFEWEIIMTNFPLDTPARKAQAVCLERVWLSNDQKCLIGSVAVLNLAFQKFVTCRFTLDYWKTTSEVAAEYMCEISPREIPQGHDRFKFTIKLSDLANLESKTLYFCIRYNVNGQELWDNNGGTNFQIDFIKKTFPQNSKRNTIDAAPRPVDNLPRSSRRANPSTGPRPTSMPGALDEFGVTSKINFDQSIHDYLGESNPSLRLKGVKSSGNLPSDNLSSRLSAPSGQAFANRYDFGASLSAAIQTAKDSMSSKPDGLYMKLNKKSSPLAASTSKAVPKPKNSIATLSPTVTAANKPASGMESSGSASISSSSYEELVNKYCFFGSKSQRLDGTDDGWGTNSTTSSDGSPVQMPGVQPRTEAQHHTLHPRDPNSYFQQSPAARTFTSSLVQSPIQNISVERISSPSAGQPRLTPPSGQATGRSLSPASMVGSFQPFAGTSPNGFAYQQLHDRFPFSGAETHSATAIRG